MRGCGAYLCDGDDHDEAALPVAFKERLVRGVVGEQGLWEAGPRLGGCGEVRLEQLLIARLDLQLPRQVGRFAQKTI